MKYRFTIFIFFLNISIFAQNIRVDTQTYTPQQLIEDVLIDNNCISNVLVTNVLGGDFGSRVKSYGFFDASGTSFPFQSGVVLSTGRTSNIQGPNITLNNDDAINWDGDSDLENILREGNSINATIIEFEFTATANQISFRYILASEEYEENDSRTCVKSDKLGFLIRKTSETQYQNIAFVPNTLTPVKVTSIHPEIQDGCPAQNETYFGQWNDASAPINFNGQTAILKAKANTIPGERYHIKLVIADSNDFMNDSAVFLEAKSFNLSTELGPDKLFSTNIPLCENETLTIDTSLDGNNDYKWFKNGSEILGEINNNYTVSEAGRYEVEVLLENGCLSYGEIIIDYSQNPLVSKTTIIQCDNNEDGLTTYNLFNGESNIINGDNTLLISNFFRSFKDAEQNINAINTPQNFQNSITQQTVYARVENTFGCFSIANVVLEISDNVIEIPPYQTCDIISNNGIIDIKITDLNTHVESFVPSESIINFFLTKNEALDNINPIINTYSNTNPYNSIYVRIENMGNCYALGSLDFVVNPIPNLASDNIVYYCSNSFPETIKLEAGVLNDLPMNYTYQWFLNNQPIIDSSYSININEAGEYSVIVTNSKDCSSSRNIKIELSNTANINDITIVDLSDNNTITINEDSLGLGDYEYALDDEFSSYQDEPFFERVKGGIHTLFVRDKNGCGTIPITISVIDYPNFFTPNGDGINENWQILGISSEFQPQSDIYIFDRHGKLMKQLNPLSEGWNGIFNGQLMPTDDYWFKVMLDDGREFKGHFTLKR